MQAFLAWLTDIWESIIPWVFVDPWEEGIRVRAGKWVKELGPGPHLTLPFLDKVEAINVKKQWQEVIEQTVETADHIPLLFNATINYEIRNAKKLWLEVQDHDDSLAEECACRLAAWVNTHNYEEMSIARLVDECYPELRKIGFRWGCEVLELGIKTWSKHRAYRILMS